MLGSEDGKADGEALGCKDGVELGVVDGAVHAGKNIFIRNFFLLALKSNT